HLAIISQVAPLVGHRCRARRGAALDLEYHGNPRSRSLELVGPAVDARDPVLLRLGSRRLASEDASSITFHESFCTLTQTRLLYGIGRLGLGSGAGACAVRSPATIVITPLFAVASWQLMAWMHENPEVVASNILPCHEPDGTWAPTEICGGFPLAPGDGTGDWSFGPKACHSENV